MTSSRGLNHWLPSYVLETPSRRAGAKARRSQLTHVFFLVCDHYEPRHAATRPEQPVERVRTWQVEYPRFQERCRQAFGHAPLHSWFYPPHHGPEHLPVLADMAFEGGGEVELHYHHENDTEATLRRDLLATLDLYNRSGLLLETGTPPRRNFGFVHGDWTLDNACNGVKCGVNGELSILADLGCWADFTMPSSNEAQTRKINSIYYAIDDPARHKSHDKGVDARAGVADQPGFLLMQGPLGINWKAPGHPRMENASLTTANWGRPDRIHKWIDCNVHVKGRPDWLFVKLHTHGAIERDFDALFGDKAFEMHRVLNESYNDGKHYQLHYVTARQAYNLVKAAEAGKSGDPRPWLDFAVAPPVTSLYALSASHATAACTPELLQVHAIAGTADTRLKTRVGPVREVRGPLAEIRVDAESGRIDLAAAGGGAELTLVLAPGARLAAERSAAITITPGATPHEYRIRLNDTNRVSLQTETGREPVPA